VLVLDVLVRPRDASLRVCDDGEEFVIDDGYDGVLFDGGGSSGCVLMNVLLLTPLYLRE